jgi:hypothetical protein
VPDDTHDDDVDDILNNCTEEEQQRYKVLINNYNRAKKNGKGRSTTVDYGDDLDKGEQQGGADENNVR